MARATRSSATQDKDKPQDPPPAQRKNAKKRKRTSIADPSDQPALKQPRTDDDIKEEDEHKQLDDDLPQDVIEIDLPTTGDVPIQSEEAEKILQVLQVIDTQSLLDRAVTLPSHIVESVTTEASTSTTTSYTLRDLLQNASRYPMRTIRAATQLLAPNPNPRSRPNTPELEQQRFFELALSLLDQASSHNAPVPLNVDSIVSAYVSATAGPSGTAPDSKPPTKVVLNSPVDASRKAKYALVQRLPTGDWWSSVDTSSALDAKNVPDLSIGRAELAAILPSSSAGAGVQKTLGEYITKKPSMLVQTANYVNQPRRVSCGKFLDYGPNASFAPSFDSDGREAGRVGLGEVVWQEQRKRRLRELAKAKQKVVLDRLKEKASASTTTATPEDEVSVVEGPSHPKEKEEANVDALEGLLSAEQISQLKSTLGSLELEQQVDELLTRNAQAITRLEALQLERLGGTNGGSSTVEVGSEEWETAQSIMESLTTLASLRPRSSKDADHPPLVPSTSALRKLHRSLPNQTQAGYYGTLPAGRTAALRDDNTLYVRAGTTVPTPAPAPSTPAAPATATPTPTAQYSGYTYAGYGNAAGYRGSYGTYGSSQTTGYYNYPTSQQTSTTSSYYPNSQYNATQQQQYSYTGAWNYQAQTAASSGHATPQPGTTPVTGSTNYTSYYNAGAMAQAQPQRAITNTVLTPTTKYQPATWPTANGATSYATATTPASALPTHLRPAASGAQGGSYYAGYAAASPR